MIAEIEAHEVEQEMLAALHRLRNDLAVIGGLVRAHPNASKTWTRLVADMYENANGLEALLSERR